MSRYKPEDYGSKTTKEQAERRRRRQQAMDKRAKEDEASRNARRKRTRFMVTLVAGAFIMAALFVLSSTLMNVRQLTQNKESAEKELAALQNKILMLQEELTQVESDEYVEQQARSELRMIHNGEVLYVIRNNTELTTGSTIQAK